ncbi:MAG: LysM peptidoglycan-binding domain-containing protein, partial [Microgenomates group bacterium]
MKLKKILKFIKLNESSISMFLGAIVLIIVGSLTVKYLRSDRGTIPEELLSGINSIESTNKVHKVEKNETLWNIAVTYYGDGFKWVDIATENKLANASEIEVGQELIIPDIELEKVVVSDEV